MGLRLPVAFMLASLSFCTVATTQQTKSYPVSFRGRGDVPIVPDKDMTLGVALWSKWSGPPGVARFHLVGTPRIISDKEVGVALIAPAKHTYILSMSGCRISINLKDGDDFLFGSVPLNVTDEVDSNGLKQDIDCVGKINMSQHDYEDFVRKGSWALSYSCP